MCGRPKQPAKVHVLVGISKRGATKIVLFTGIMNATRYTDVLDSALVPFIEENNRIMTLNIPAGGHKITLKEKASSGGERLLQVQT